MIRLLFVSLVLVSSAVFAAGESAAFVNLAVDPSPGLNEPVEALQKKFFAVAREKSGYTLALRAEVEDALKKSKVTEFAADAELAKVAKAANAKNAGYFTLRVTEMDTLLLQGRVVNDEGKLLKSALISVPRNGESLSDALARAGGKFFDTLNGVAQPEPLAANGNSAPTPPPMMIRPSEPPNPGTPLRIAGAVVGGVGLATVVTGVVLLATSGTVEKDMYGNISVRDLPRVPGIQSKQGAALGALTAGAAVTLTGVLMVVLAPNAPVTAGIAPTSDGAMFAVGGSF
ncbi:MAG: hypothetical protein QM817_36110 [Archangium sp.]